MNKTTIFVIIGLIIVVTLIILFNFKTEPGIAINVPEVTANTILSPVDFPSKTIPHLESELNNIK
ncbi:MAG TPA: hypothetical protein PLH82_02015 [Candidatus Paceibacterota bacterium]|jgi:hypothetical protein|nr:hypothetical protein [Candidatus Paceibacterota bacterium]